MSQIGILAIILFVGMGAQQLILLWRATLPINWHQRVIEYRRHVLAAWIVLLWFVQLAFLVFVLWGEPSMIPTVPPSVDDYASLWANSSAFSISLGITLFASISLFVFEYLLVRPFEGRRGPRRYVWFTWFLLAACLPNLFGWFIGHLPRPQTAQAAIDSGTGTPTTNEATTSTTAPVHGAKTATAGKPVWKSKASRNLGVAISVLGTASLGACYLLWVGVAVFRQVSDVDKLKGPVAKRFAFFSFGGLILRQFRRIPFQAVVIGPRSSGKTNLFLFGLETRDHYDWAVRNDATRQPTKAPCACRYLSDDNEHDVSAIDTGGENLADQFSIMRQSRIDRLVIVINAKHLLDNVAVLPKNRWTIPNVGGVFDEAYNETATLPDGTTRTEPLGESSSVYFKALNLATTGTSDPSVHDHTDVPEAHSVLVVLNSGDRNGDGERKCIAVPIENLLELAKSVSERFPVFDASSERVDVPVAAWKVDLSPTEGVLTIDWTGKPHPTRRDVVGGASF
jgi:hypothetical protein